jgi:transcription elongation factor GreA
VGSDEADPMSGKISFESPIGASLIGHKVGDIIGVNTPAGSQKYEIVGIS